MIHLGELRVLRLLSFSGLLVLALLAVPFSSLNAFAMIGGCRSDPTVLLSNGSLLDLSATIGDTQSDVRTVSYVLHGPAKTSVVTLVNTDGLMGLAEHFQYVADDAAGTYDSYMTVTTGKSKVSVTTTAVVVGLLSIGIPSASGTSGQTLHVHVPPLL